MSFGKFLLLGLALLPLAEIAVFAAVAAAIGLLAAFGLLLLACAAGAVMLHRAGRAQMAQVRLALGGAELTAVEIRKLSFVHVLVGVLLLIPGFLTDLAGLLLLVPAVRRGLAAAVSRAVGGGDGRPADRVVDLDQRDWRRVPDRELPRRDRDEDGISGF